MKRLLTTHLVLAVASALLAVGCGEKPPPQEPEGGAANFTIAASQALSAEDVTRVTVTLSAADIPSITIELTETGGVWGGTLSGIRAGTNRNFTAEAFDAANEKIFEGQAQGVTIVNGQTTEVVIVLQPLDRPDPFENASPIIDSVVASARSVEPVGSSPCGRRRGIRTRRMSSPTHGRARAAPSPTRPRSSPPGPRPRRRAPTR